MTNSLPRPLKSHEQDACLDLWDAAFTNTPRDYFIKYFKHDSNYQQGDTIVIEVGGQIVSAVHVVRREAYTRTGIIGVGGIANVATHPDFRGQGYNSACLNAMIAHLEADPFFEMSLLGTGINDYYAKFGWQDWPLPVLTFMPKYILQTNDIIPATEADLPCIQTLHTTYNQHQPLAFCRTPNEQYWKNWMHWAPQNTFLTPNKEAYAKISKKEEGMFWHIDEVGGSGAGIEHLILSISVMAHAQETVALLLRFPLSFEIASRVAQIGNNIKQVSNNNWMVRPHKDKPLPDLTNGYFYGADGF